MPWFKVDDQLAFNAKVVAAGNSAIGLWARAGSWSSAQLTDGFIPTHMANAMANPMANPCDPDALVIAGLWDVVEGGYQFHDWADFQPSAEAEREKRKARSQAGRKGAEARWGGKTDGKSHSKSHGKPIANECDRNAPSRPVPSNAEAKASSSDVDTPDPGTQFSPDIEDLCQHLADHIAKNGNKVGTIGIRWKQAADRLIRIDGYTPDQIRQVIDWSQQDEFWQGNILSMPKLREKFDQLKTRMLNERNRPAPNHQGQRMTHADRALAKGAELLANYEARRQPHAHQPPLLAEIEG